MNGGPAGKVGALKYFQEIPPELFLLSVVEYGMKECGNDKRFHG